MTGIYRVALLLFATFGAAFAQPSFTQCDINRDKVLSYADIAALATEATTTTGSDDLNADGKVNVIDVQVLIDGILNSGCPRDLVTPTFALTSITVLNQAWIPADIPSPGDLTLHGVSASGISLLNQYWIPTDIPSPGDLSYHAAYSLAPSVLNRAWIPADIPSAGDLSYHAAYSLTPSVLNQAWISADIPSPGNVKFAAGLLVTVNNTAVQGPLSQHPDLSAKVIAGGSNTVADFASVTDGEALIAGQTVRFRVSPPKDAIPGSDFFINGAPLRVHQPFEVLVTAPAGIAAFDLQAVVYPEGGRTWRLPSKHILIIPDPGLAMVGHAAQADGSPAAAATVGVRVSGLAAEYFRAGDAPLSWAALGRPADRLGFVTAVNQPNPGGAFGADPFGAGLSASYFARFHGEILVTDAGSHEFFLDAALGARLTIDSHPVIDAPPGGFTAELQGRADLTPGWHAIEIASYQTAANPNLQLSWRQPTGGREIVRPEELAAEWATTAVTGSDGGFRLAAFPGILTPLEWHTVPANKDVRVMLDQSTFGPRPTQK